MVVAAAIATMGLRAYLLIQIPIMAVAGVVGTWLFYVQHQFEDVYWARHEDWDAYRASTMCAARRSRNSASSREITPCRIMTSEVSTKMTTVIVFTGLAALLLSTMTSTKNDTIIAM